MSESESGSDTEEGYVAGRRTTAVGDMLRGGGGGGGGSKRYMDMTEEEEAAYNSYVEYKKSQKYGGGGGGSSASEFKELSREEKEELSLPELRKYLAAKEKHDREEGGKPDKEEFLRRYRVKEGASKQPPPPPVEKSRPAQKPRPARPSRLTLPQWEALLTQKVEALMATGRYNRKTAQYTILENDDEIKKEIDWVKTHKERAEAKAQAEAKRQPGRK